MSIIKRIKEIEFPKSTKKTKEMISKISKEILQNYYIQFNEKDIWDIIEIEFYYHSEFHKDIYAHVHSIGDLPFYETGQFRIHGAGIDIAISDSEKKSYGGILIRTIEKKSEERIEGPVKVCDAIIKNMGNVEGSSISFVKRENPISINIYQAPRVGLIPKKDSYLEEEFKFLVEDYRFFTDLKLKNEKYFIALRNNNNEMKLDKSTLLNYTKSYSKGKGISHFEELKRVVLNDFTSTQSKALLMGYFNKNNNS
jgi:hypothetical protein